MDIRPLPYPATMIAPMPTPVPYSVIITAHNEADPDVLPRSSNSPPWR